MIKKKTGRPMAILIVLSMVIPMLATGCITFAAQQDNLLPNAFIDLITPEGVHAGEMVTFEGHGTDPDGTIVAYRWRSDLDGNLSTRARFRTTSLSAGVHMIYFMVQDNNGDWSAEVRSRVTVSNAGAALPAINSFNASPVTITSGETATLSWDVSNTTTVSIDQGIGPVPLTGIWAVAPDSTTIYTLTATNESGSVTARAQVSVSENSLPEPPPVEAAPTIVIFEVDPVSLVAGNSATLLWNVTGATNISIDQGIGNVAAAGAQEVTPKTTTVYTLTATNDAGTVTESLTLTVVPLIQPIIPLLTFKPDLVITAVQKEAGADGYNIGYTIKNQGLVNAGACTQKLYVNGVYKASDLIPALDAGASVDRQFAGWVYDPCTPTIKVVADANGSVEEVNEDNNKKQVVMAVQTVVDYVARASDASWSSSAGDLSFPGGTGDEEGFVLYKVNAMLEDNVAYAKVLETHPEWTENGWICGWYPVMEIPFGAKFIANVGFLKGAAGSDGVTFRAWFWESGKWFPYQVTEINATYNNQLDTINISLANYAGKTGKVGLAVYAGASSGQDWAVWQGVKMIR